MSRRLVALGVMAAVAAGCTGTPTSAQPTDDDGTNAARVAADPFDVVPLVDPGTPQLPVTVTSADGAEVTVDDVSRTVVATGAVAEIVYALGLGDVVVGRDVATTFAAAEDVPVVTNGHDLSAEGVLALRPTLVVGDATTGPPEVLAQLRAAGVPVVLVDEAWSLDAVRPRIAAVATTLGVPDAGDDLIALTERATERVADRASLPPIRVAFLYLRGTAGVYLIGGDGAGADALLEALGVVDAGSAAGLTGFTPITSEALIDAAPDVILVMERGLDSVGGVDGLLELPGVAQTPAGRDRRVVAVEDGLLLNFGPRTGAVLDLLADELDDLLATT